MAFEDINVFGQSTRLDSSDHPRAILDSVESLFRDIEEKASLNAFVTLAKAEAVERAAHSDERVKAGTARRLEGFPIAVKDNFCTKGIRTTACSKILETFVPTYESFVTQRLLDAGAVILGKTNMDEFGMGSSTEHSLFGPSLNPLPSTDGKSHVAGGSSGGSAVAVAANLAWAAIGSDTGGSIRQPAAFCGVVGFKPTYGLCSRWGLIAYASSLDQPGTITKTVADACTLLEVIVAKDSRDSTSIDYLGDKFDDCLEGDFARPIRLGVPIEFMDQFSGADISVLWERTKEACALGNIEIVPVSLPNIKYALPTYYIIALSEASSNLARFDGVKYGLRASGNSLVDMYEETRSLGFGDEVKRRIILGTYSLSAGHYEQYYGKATKVRRKIKDDFDSALKNVDALIWPTTPTPAFEIGKANLDPATIYLEDVFTVPVNLVGAPAISVPMSYASNGLPMGVQIVGPRMGDATVLKIANRLEQSASWMKR